MTETPPPMVIDARGHRCPVPTLRLSRALARAGAGQIVRLIADDPLARIDVPHFIREQGYRLKSVAGEGEALIFDVCRP